MTTINASLKDSYGNPLKGYIQVKLDYLINDRIQNETYLPVSYKVPLVNGQVSMNLEPSEQARVSYLFQVYEQREETVINDDGTTSVVTNDYLVWDFHGKVPDSTTPINFADLATTTGITHDQQDASFAAIARYMLLSDDFWSQFQQQVLQAKGQFNPQSFYKYGDVVTSDGSSYVYINAIATQGKTPPDSTYWQLLAQRGATGTGTAGNDTPYSAAAWENQTDAPSRNAVRDIIETLATKTEVNSKVGSVNAALTSPTLVNRPSVSDRSTKIVDSGWIQAVLDIIRKALVPVGTITAFAGSSAPLGWLLCDGRTLSRSTYAELFNILSTLYNTGGEASTDFRLPDFRGRAVIGANISLLTGNAGRSPSWADNPGGNGGTAQQTLTIAQLPAHNHQLKLHKSVRELAGSALAGGGAFVDRVIVDSPNFSSFDESLTSGVGSGQAHNNMQPSLACNIIIYSGV